MITFIYLSRKQTRMARIITVKPLKEFMTANPKYIGALEAWITIVESSKWEKPQDIVASFGANNIDLLGKKDNKPNTISSKRVVFDVKGNHIRIIAKYQFHEKLKESILYIKWIGTHSEYDKLNNKNAQYDIDMFG